MYVENILITKSIQKNSSAVMIWYPLRNPSKTPLRSSEIQCFTKSEPSSIQHGSEQTRCQQSDHA